MKKYRIVLVMGIMAVSLAACGQSEQDQNKAQSQNEVQSQNQAQSQNSEVQSQSKSDMEQTATAAMNSDTAYEDVNYDTPADYVARQPGREYGVVEDVTYYSGTVRRNRTAAVALPANYDPAKEYPVLYVLGGWGGDKDMWISMGVGDIVQNAHYDDNAPEMIVVSPCVFTSVDGESQDGLAFDEATKAFDQFINDLEDNLMPYINSHYSVKTGPEYTAVAGLSLGGREAVYIGLEHPEQFGYIAGFSTTGGLFTRSAWAEPLLENYDLDAVRDTYRYILLSIGGEDPYIESAMEYNAAFDAHGIRYSYYMTQGGHEGKVWQQGIYNFARRIF